MRSYFYSFRDLDNYCRSQYVKDILLVHSTYHDRFDLNDFAILINAGEDRLMVWLTSMGKLPILGQHLSDVSGVTYSIRDDKVKIHYPRISQGVTWSLLSRLTAQELSKFLEFFDLFVK